VGMRSTHCGAMEIDHLEFYVGNGKTSNVVRSDALTPLAWHFVLAWHDARKDTINIIIDNGAPVSVRHHIGTHNSAAAFGIGANPSDFIGWGYWEGLIYEVGVWKKVLSKNERVALYKGIPFNGRLSGINEQRKLSKRLVGYWTWDEAREVWHDRLDTSSQIKEMPSIKVVKITHSISEATSIDVAKLHEVITDLRPVQLAMATSLATDFPSSVSDAGLSSETHIDALDEVSQFQDMALDLEPIQLAMATSLATDFPSTVIDAGFGSETHTDFFEVSQTELPLDPEPIQLAMATSTATDFPSSASDAVVSSGFSSDLTMRRKMIGHPFIMAQKQEPQLVQHGETDLESIAMSIYEIEVGDSVGEYRHIKNKRFGWWAGQIPQIDDEAWMVIDETKPSAPLSIIILIVSFLASCQANTKCQARGVNASDLTTLEVFPFPT